MHRHFLHGLHNNLVLYCHFIMTHQHKYRHIDDTFDTVAEESTEELCILDPTDILQIVVSGLGICVCELYVCKSTHNTRFISSVGRHFF